MSDLNGAGSSPVMRSEAGWRAVMADHEAPGMTRPGFRESRGLSRRIFRNRRRRPGHPVAGKAGSFIEVAPPSMPGRDIGPEPGGGMILRLGRPVPGRPAGRPAASGCRRSRRTCANPSTGSVHWCRPVPGRIRHAGAGTCSSIVAGP